MGFAGLKLPLKSLVVTHQEILIIVVEVHAITFAVLPHFAIGTLALLGPATVAELLEAILPHIPEVILVDITLGEVGSYAGATRDIAIDTNGGDTHARMALKGVGAHTHLVAREKALAAI